MMKIHIALTTLLLAAASFMAPASAETLNIKFGDITYSIPHHMPGDMPLSDTGVLTILGKEYNLKEASEIYVDKSDVAEKSLLISYSGDKASVSVPGDIAKYVEVSVDGAHVSVIQSADVSDDTCGELTYILSGTSSNGSFYMEGSFKAEVEMRGLTLTNPSGAPIDIQNGKRIKLSVKADTENTLTDCTSGKQKGVIVCKGHLEIKGKGVLNLYGNTAHALYAKEYIELKNAKINILSAVKDGVNCNQYFLMESGTLNISGVGDDGMQVSFKDDADREAEDIGSITIAGGKISVASTTTAAKAIKADGDITISGGEITASASGGGLWDADKVKTKGAACLGADGNITISGGTLNLTATGSAGKGINTDGELNISGGKLNIKTSGGIFAYVNGKEYDNYTGNTDRLDSDMKSSPKGIKADGGVTIDGGEINVATTGHGGEGIESKSILTINAGTIAINAYDDAINSSSHMYINGGDITVISTNNDGLDSNGNLYIAGGVIRAFGGNSPECGIDANEEEGYSVFFTGGILLAAGGGNSTPSKSTSTQAYVSGSASISAGQTVTLKSGDTEFCSFEIPENYKGSSTSSGGGWNWGGGPGGGMNRGGSILITCPDLKSGSSYTLTCGSSSSNVTARLTGSSGGRW